MWWMRRGRRGIGVALFAGLHYGVSVFVFGFGVGER